MGKENLASFHCTELVNFAGCSIGCGRPRVVNPGFGSHELEREANPESRAEEFVGREAGEVARGKEKADDRADCGDGKTGGEGPDHPLAMKCDFAAPNVPEGFSQREKKERGEERGGGRLVHAANCRHRETHDQGGDSDDGGAREKDAAVDAMQFRMAGANRRTKLKWAENHEQKAGSDVNECKSRVVSEKIVEWRELRGDGIRWGGRPITVNEHGNENDNSPHGNRHANYSQKNRPGPQDAAKTRTRLHTSCYVDGAGFISPARQATQRLDPLCSSASPCRRDWRGVDHSSWHFQ
jgi:hypothetical protein